ncbi:hypothetical protein HW555_005711 [Spodoptera exigua]|uniref:Uncharacterized protein n=1 Tax=Spodoptera exigua TaxID=7107 RepID=A0A835GJZ5_SPOEX|nr:hypothetical protein HW555_005711 [Spodoptera exigua]
MPLWALYTAEKKNPSHMCLTRRAHARNKYGRRLQPIVAQHWMSPYDRVVCGEFNVFTGYKSRPNLHL